MIEHALIMAGGRGRRLMPLTKDIPKPLLSINENKLIANSIDQLHKTIANVSVTVGYKGGALAKYCIDKKVNNIFNTTGQGNAWWVYNTYLKNVDDAVLVLTCDNIVELDFQWLENEYLRLQCPPCMIVPVSPILGIDGDFISHNEGKVLKLSRKDIGQTYCSGIQVMNPKTINNITKISNNFNLLWHQLINNGTLFCSKTYTKNWYSVNSIEQLNHARETNIDQAEDCQNSIQNFKRKNFT